MQRVFVRNMEKVKQEGTEIDLYLLNRGFTDPGFFPYTVFNVRNNYELFEAALSLADDGYDALVLHCASDPHLDPIRQALDIPVVGVFQAGLLMALTMGHRIGVVTFDYRVVPFFTDLVGIYGLTDKVVAVESTDSSGEELMMCMLDAHAAIARFSEVAGRCIADGAEVLVPG
ncbi:MAG: hypothetical protein C4536_14075 [Actinobacteria bacterium]|jgi:allantoin racemase|nr:MAG: hypothetical protein C4536_14075 [Actinomycetota bacterium]